MLDREILSKEIRNSKKILHSKSHAGKSNVTKATNVTKTSFFPVVITVLLW
jgi:hypothetical protein